MESVHVIIDSSLKTVWPAACLGCITYAVEVNSVNPRLWAYYNKNFLPRLTRKLAEGDLAGMPQIKDSRDAYKAFGVKSDRRQSFSEVLYRRIQQGKGLYQINSLADANNLISLETGFSLGSYDMSRIGQGIIFRLGISGESFPGIGKSSGDLGNMPVLTDILGPFGSPSGDLERGMISLGTKAGLTVIYSFSGEKALLAALKPAEQRLRQFAGVTSVRSFTVH